MYASCARNHGGRKAREGVDQIRDNQPLFFPFFSFNQNLSGWAEFSDPIAQVFPNIQ